MGIVDAFAAEEKINMRFSEFHALVNAAVKSEFLVNAVNANVPHRYIRGMLTALGIPYQLVPPAKWKKEFSLIGKDKQASIMTCRKLFPELDLKRTERCKTDSDGKAEATLICEYARRHFG